MIKQSWSSLSGSPHLKHTSSPWAEAAPSANNSATKEPGVNGTDGAATEDDATFGNGEATLLKRRKGCGGVIGRSTAAKRACACRGDEGTGVGAGAVGATGAGGAAASASAGRGAFSNLLRSAWAAFFSVFGSTVPDVYKSRVP